MSRTGGTRGCSAWCGLFFFTRYPRFGLRESCVPSNTSLQRNGLTAVYNTRWPSPTLLYFSLLFSKSKGGWEKYTGDGDCHSDSYPHTYHFHSPISLNHKRETYLGRVLALLTAFYIVYPEHSYNIHRSKYPVYQLPHSLP